MVRSSFSLCLCVYVCLVLYRQLRARLSRMRISMRPFFILMYSPKVVPNKFNPFYLT